MRVLLLTIFIFTFLQASSAKAQETQTLSSTIGISTRIAQSIELITVKSMTFGNTQPGQEEIYVNPVVDANAGYMIAVGTPEAEFRLNFLQERRLSRIEGPGFLIFTYELSGNDIEDQSSSEVIENENQTLKFNLDGEYHIWVGGIVVLTNAQPGNYEGDFTIEIDYI
ncbi:MAG: hypothetical protein ED557_02795 [Balneola sp.]|nr:MAG: hypothetical protein ED557_02795 [Balneola sp.]